MLFLSLVIFILKTLKLLDISWRSTRFIIALALSIKALKLFKQEEDEYRAREQKKGTNQ